MAFSHTSYSLWLLQGWPKAKSQPASAESLGKPSGFELCYGGWNFVEEGKVTPEKTKYGRA